MSDGVRDNYLNPRSEEIPCPCCGNKGGRCDCERTLAALLEIQQLVLPNHAGASHAALMEELRAWERHADANIANADRANKAEARIAELERANKALDNLLRAAVVERDALAADNDLSALTELSVEIGRRGAIARRYEDCLTCGGDGVLHGYTCENCRGEGKVRK